jgi:hypothetical protein
MFLENAREPRPELDHRHVEALPVGLIETCCKHAVSSCVLDPRIHRKRIRAFVSADGSRIVTQMPGLARRSHATV